MFLIIAALLATAAVGGIVILTVFRSIRKEQRGFAVKPPPQQPEDERESRP